MRRQIIKKEMINSNKEEMEKMILKPLGQFSKSVVSQSSKGFFMKFIPQKEDKVIPEVKEMSERDASPK
jgi:hypothetical protein